MKAVITASLLGSSLVSAHQPTIWECQGMAQDVFEQLKDRDEGMTLAAAQKEADELLPKCRLEHPKCAYKDAEDDKRVHDFLNFIYTDEGKKVEPEVGAIRFFNACKANATEEGLPEEQNHRDDIKS